MHNDCDKNTIINIIFIESDTETWKIPEKRFFEQQGQDTGSILFTSSYWNLYLTQLEQLLMRQDM